MNENQPSQEDAIKSERAARKLECARLAECLEGVKFAFPGISEQYAASLKAERDEMQEYFTGTWDELMDKFADQGAKVHTGKNGEIHIMPAESTDIENDSIMPRHLEVSDTMDANLQQLISLSQK